MPDKEYKIRITTAADPTGLQQMSSGISEVTEKTKQSSAANEEHHKSFVHAGNGAREFHRLLHAVAEESPMMGLALRLALSPVGGALVAAMGLFRELKQAEEESLKSAAENAALAAKGLGDMKQSAFEAGEEIAKHNREYASWLDNLNLGTSAVKDSLSEELTLIQETAQAYEKVQEQQKDLQLAQVSEAKRTGQISEEQAILQESEIERQFAHKVSDVKVDAMKAEFAAKGKALMDTSGQMVALGADQGRLQAGAEDQTRAALLKDLPKRITDAQKQAEEFSKLMASAGEKLDALQRGEVGGPEFLGSTVGPQDMQRIKQQHEETIRKAEAEFEQYRRLKEGEEAVVARSREEIKKLTTEQDNWNTTLDRNKKQFSELNSQFEQLSREVEALRIKLSVQGPAQAAGLRIGDEAAGARAFGKIAGTDIGKLLFAQGGGAVDAAYDIVQGRGITRGGSEDRALSQLISMLHVQADQVGKLLVALSNAHDSITGLESAVNTIQARFEQLKSRIATRTLPGGNP